MWPRVLAPARAIAFDTVLSLLRGVPGTRALQSENRRHDGIPMFVMMPMDFALGSEWLDHGGLEEALTTLKNAGVTGIMVDVWWGLCEKTPGQYEFDKYIELAQLCRQLGLQIQATMCFHACGGNVGDNVNIPIPSWASAAADEHGAWYRDRERYFRRDVEPNRECISLSADEVAFLPSPIPELLSPVKSPNGNVANDETASVSSFNTESGGPLRMAGAPSLNLGLVEVENAVQSGPALSPRIVHNSSRSNLLQDTIPLRTPLDVYEAFIGAFCAELRDFFEDVIVELQIGMGPCGELRYPSYPLANGKWAFPGIGEFQCYDDRMLRMLSIAAEAAGHPEWGVPPDGAGEYNDSPWDTVFFRRRGGHRSAYGRFFLRWYSDVLLDHGETMLSRARKVAPANMTLAVKISGVHWWYFTAGRAAEATAGYYMARDHDFYERAATMLGRYNAVLDFTCLEMKTSAQPWRLARCGPRQLVRDVFRTAARKKVVVAGENALECYDWGRYAQVVSAFRWSKARAHGFTLLRLGPTMLEAQHLKNVSRLAGELRGIRPLDNNV